VQPLYFVLAAIHMAAVVLTGMLWTAYDLGFQAKLRPYLRDIRAVHFGSLYLVPWFLGLARIRTVLTHKLRTTDHQRIRRASPP
jgi:hypothetical protein